MNSDSKTKITKLYIQPNFNLFSSINEVDTQRSIFNKPNWSFDDFLNNRKKHLYIVADPGYGKTRLMQEIVLNKPNTLYIDLKKLEKKSIFDYQKSHLSESFLRTVQLNVNSLNISCNIFNSPQN